MKYFEYRIHPYETRVYFSPIRKKVDAILILMTALKSMLIQEPGPHVDASEKIVLCVDKMSRIFFISEKKIYTLSFPFSASMKEDGGLIFSSDVVGEINSQIATSILNIALSVQETELLDLGVVIEDNAIPFCDIWSLFRFLLLHEDGYVRFDHDPKHVDGLRHPLNHLDIFYSNKSMFKVGLHGIADLEMFTDILDRDSSCHFLSQVT